MLYLRTTWAGVFLCGEDCTRRPLHRLGGWSGGGGGAGCRQSAQHGRAGRRHVAGSTGGPEPDRTPRPFTFKLFPGLSTLFLFPVVTSQIAVRGADTCTRERESPMGHEGAGLQCGSCSGSCASCQHPRQGRVVWARTASETARGVHCVLLAAPAYPGCGAGFCLLGPQRLAGHLMEPCRATVRVLVSGSHGAQPLLWLRSTGSSGGLCHCFWAWVTMGNPVITQPQLLGFSAETQIFLEKCLEMVFLCQATAVWE